MALTMPRPFKHKTGVFFLNVRVPGDLLPGLRGRSVSLPVGDQLVTVSLTQKVFLSLRTKDANQARERFAASYAALVAHWAAARNGPKPLTHKQLVALAGEAYVFLAQSLENDPTYGPHVLRNGRAMHQECVDEFRYGEPGEPELDETSARFLADLQLPYGPQLMALKLGRDLDTPYVKVTYQQALEDLVGEHVNRVCATRSLLLDEPTRARLLVEVGRAMGLLNEKLNANARSDYSVDHSRTFPAFAEVAAQPASKAAVAGTVTITAQVERFMAHFADKKAPSTLRRYTPSLRSFAEFNKNKDVRLVSDDDVLRWAEHRRDVDCIAVATVNGNDLVAVASLFTFSSKGLFGGKLRGDNPAASIKLELPKRDDDLDHTFTEDEACSILELSRTVKPRTGYPRASACRRWAPWICAYTGARIQEVCSLERKDIRYRDGIPAIHFPRTKEGIARWVVMHDALVAEGLLTFWQAAPEGPLFTGDKPQKEGASRRAAEQRASEMSAWISRNVELRVGVSPNHGWRHVFITRAREAYFQPLEMIEVITGHNRRKNAAAGYYSPSARAMKREMDKYPPYVLSPDSA